MELQEPSLQMLRERHKWKSHEADNIDAASRDGAARSSDEESVMDLEQRGSRNQSMGANWKQDEHQSVRTWW